MGLYVDFVRFPEKYMTTWKYQLKNEIASGDQKAIDYYNKYYTSKGVYLYGEDAAPETEHGILLHTEDGNGSGEVFRKQFQEIKNGGFKDDY